MGEGGRRSWREREGRTGQAGAIAVMREGGIKKASIQALERSPVRRSASTANRRGVSSLQSCIGDRDLVVEHQPVYAHATGRPIGLIAQLVLANARDARVSNFGRLCELDIAR